MNRIKQFLSRYDYIDFLVKLVWVKVQKYCFYLKYSGTKVNEKQILFESFQGKFINDSPRAIYEKFIELKVDIEPVWVVKNVDQKVLLEGLSKYLGTKFVEYGSKEYVEAYVTSACWIVNCRTPVNIFKKKGQQLIQCWHGTPLKKMGHDIIRGNNSTTSLKGMKFVYSIEESKVDYFVSPSKYATDCFCSSFRMNSRKVLEIGYPRNDELVKFKKQNDYITDIKRKLGIELDKQVILYAPTYRDNQYCQERESHTLQNPLESEEFLSALSNCVFLYRGHYFTKPESKMDSFIDLSDHNNLNELLLVSDLLITDYSSIFFDFLILEREIIFYMPDIDEYANDSRGFYLNIEESLPGDITRSIPELLDSITSNISNEGRIVNFNSIFNPHEDGSSALRLIKSLDFY